MPRSLDMLTEVCEGLPVTVRRMFGGHGFFAPNGGMFAGIVTDDEVVFKLTHGPARDELIAAGGHPWVYDGAGRAMTMADWIVVPESFYDDPETFAAWARRAHELVPPKVAKRSPRRSRAATPARKAPARGKKTSRGR